MVYVDTSALVPVFIREAKTDAIHDWLESEAPRLAISEWSLVEFASACAIKTRTGQISGSLAGQAWAALVDFTEDRCLIAHAGRGDFRKAAEMARHGSHNLRAGDALHIAIAEAIADRLLTLDGAMLEAAKQIDLPTITF